MSSFFSGIWGSRKASSGPSSSNAAPAKKTPGPTQKTTLVAGDKIKGTSIEEYEVVTVAQELSGYLVKKAMRTPENIERDAANISNRIVKYFLIIDDEDKIEPIYEAFRNIIKSKEIDGIGFCFNDETHKIFVTDTGFNCLYTFMNENRGIIAGFDPTNKQALLDCTDSKYNEFLDKLKIEGLLP